MIQICPPTTYLIKLQKVPILQYEAEEGHCSTFVVVLGSERIKSGADGSSPPSRN